MAARTSRLALACSAIPIVLSGCATRPGMTAAGDRPAAVETISYEVGPCFGFCPVYNASVSSDGRVAFEGKRHTAVLGLKSVRIGTGAYAAFAEALAPYKPAAGARETTNCDTRISDQQHYRITWISPDGTTSVLDHDRGCRSRRNDALNAVLQGAPELLGLSDYAHQITRPGESRG